MGGPVGAVVGGVVGAVAGGAAGHAAGEALDPTVEASTGEELQPRPTTRRARRYADYEPAYRYGWESAARPEYKNRKFDEVEHDLETGWDKAKGETRKAGTTSRTPPGTRGVASATTRSVPWKRDPVGGPAATRADFLTVNGASFGT